MDWDAIILHEHDGLIILDKPAGLPTSGDSLEQPGSLQFEVMQKYRRMIWAVHQLDKYTTGLNVFVRRKKLVPVWQENLRRGKKTYLAVCEGRITKTEFTVNAPLEWSPDKSRVVVSASGREAITDVTVIASSATHTLVSVVIHTGRTHQIRVHLESQGHPLVGDLHYGGESPHIERQALHAWRLEAGGESFSAPIPADFRALLDALGLPEPEQAG